MLRESNCLTAPAAVLRGLTKTLLPSVSALALMRAKPALPRNISPRTSSRAGGDWLSSRKGILLIVRTLCVMSSPVMPSPRVAPRVSTPFSYNKLTATPSILGSQLNCSGSSDFSALNKRCSKLRNSSSLFTFASDSMGFSWVT